MTLPKKSQPHPVPRLTYRFTTSRLRSPLGILSGDSLPPSLLDSAEFRLLFCPPPVPSVPPQSIPIQVGAESTTVTARDPLQTAFSIRRFCTHGYFYCTHGAVAIINGIVSNVYCVRHIYIYFRITNQHHTPGLYAPCRDKYPTVRINAPTIQRSSWFPEHKPWNHFPTVQRLCSVPWQGLHVHVAPASFPPNAQPVPPPPRWPRKAIKPLLIPDQGECHLATDRPPDAPHKLPSKTLLLRCSKKNPPCFWSPVGN